MLKKIKVGEIIKIENREYLVTTESIGCCEKKRVSLVLLEKLFKKTLRKPYYKKLLWRNNGK
jgi:hypothetical protein